MKSRIRKRQHYSGDTIFNIVNYIFLSLALVSVLYPLIYIVSSSFSSGQAVLTGKIRLFPVDINIRAYRAVFAYKPIVTGYLNSILYTVGCTVLNIMMTVLAAYPLSRKELYGRGGIMFFFMFTMMFSGGMIPSYLLMNNLHLLNNRLVMIIPGAMGVYNVIIARTYFQTTIPDELLEAAKLDGCNDILFLIKIVLPLSKAIISVVILFVAVGSWNSYFNAMLYLSDTSKFPLQMVLRDILIQNRMDGSMLSVDTLMKKQELSELLKYSSIVVSSLPLLIMYPFVQKNFVKGMMIGSVKG